MFVFTTWREPMVSDESNKREHALADETSSSPVSSTPNTSTPKGNGVRVDGHTFWRATPPGRGMQRSIELTTATGIEVDPERCRWTVSTPGSRGAGDPVESRSREVYRFMAGVLGSMQRATRRASVRPVPKPVPKAAPAIPPTAPVPCPLCRGEAWPDCELCDGAGVVTQRRASEWLDERAPHRLD
jgi:hypothetical protein